MRHGSARPKGADAPTPSYFEWKVEGNPLSVQISFAVIDQLEADIMKGFWSVPKRGAEVGGVLFGRIDSGEKTTVWIEDYEPVACEYRRGPSYVLSENDRKRLERTLRRQEEGERQIVGYYRSHTRLGLYLDQDDFTLIQSYFADPRYVALLVRPHASKTSVGGFFFWEEGTIHRQSTYLEFPFSTAEILKRLRGPDSDAMELQPAAQAMPAPLPQPAQTQPPAATKAESPNVRLPDLEKFLRPAFAAVRNVRWRSLPVMALLILGLAFTEYELIRVFARRNPPPGYLPALRIERNGNYLQVNWNRSAPSILNADRAVLLITDGDYRKELHLDARQLRDGSIAYSPSGNDVSFRLELVGGRTTVSESLRVVEAPGVAPAAPAVSSNAPARSTHAAPRQQLTLRSPARELAPRSQARIRRHGFFDDGL